MASAIKVKFWGTRGLISSPSLDTVEFGGNTSCIQLMYEKRLIIIDTGFGVSNLGEILMQRILERKDPLEIFIFFTHFHWDHIQGLPFFHPIYFPSTTIHLFSPVDKELSRQSLDVLFDGSYSPFAGIDNMPAKTVFHQLNGGFSLGDLHVDYTPVDHGWTQGSSPMAFAYRFRIDDLTLVIACDHEARPGPINDDLCTFAKGANLLIHDAQFSEEEYHSRKGWGHSTFAQALDNALACGAKQTLLTHHAPTRSDGQIRSFYETLKKDPKYCDLNFEFAREHCLYSLK